LSPEQKDSVWTALSPLVGDRKAYRSARRQVCADLDRTERAIDTVFHALLAERGKPVSAGQTVPEGGI
jgi:hypothetical protein